MRSGRDGPGSAGAAATRSADHERSAARTKAIIHDRSPLRAPDRHRALGTAVRSQFPNGTVSSVSFVLVSTTNTARSLAGSVSLALALTPWRSPGSSEKLSPAL